MNNVRDDYPRKPDGSTCNSRLSFYRTRYHAMLSDQKVKRGWKSGWTGDQESLDHFSKAGPTVKLFNLVCQLCAERLSLHGESTGSYSDYSELQRKEAFWRKLYADTGKTDLHEILSFWWWTTGSDDGNCRGDLQPGSRCLLKENTARLGGE